MKTIKLRPLTIACLAATTAFISARTWTSADGTKTFEGDLKDFDNVSGKVTVLSKGRQLVFDQDKLSEEDQAFLLEWKVEADKPEPAEILENQEVGKQLTERVLSRLDKKRFKRASLEKTPEYYLVYFSASW